MSDLRAVVEDTEHVGGNEDSQCCEEVEKTDDAHGDRTEEEKHHIAEDVTVETEKAAELQVPGEIEASSAASEQIPEQPPADPATAEAADLQVPGEIEASCAASEQIPEQPPADPSTAEAALGEIEARCIPTEQMAEEPPPAPSTVEAALDSLPSAQKITDDLILKFELSTRGGSSQYRGVSFAKTSDRWLAQYTEDGKPKKLGLYASEVEAAHAYYCWQNSLPIPPSTFIKKADKERTTSTAATAKDSPNKALHLDAKTDAQTGSQQPEPEPAPAIRKSTILPHLGPHSSLEELLPADAPKGHAAWKAVKHWRSSNRCFFALDKVRTETFQVSQILAGSEDNCRRIARACYMKFFDKLWDKDMVTEFKERCLARVQGKSFEALDSDEELMCSGGSSAATGVKGETKGSDGETKKTTEPAAGVKGGSSVEAVVKEKTTKGKTKASDTEAKMSMEPAAPVDVGGSSVEAIVKENSQKGKTKASDSEAKMSIEPAVPVDAGSSPAVTKIKDTTQEPGAVIDEDSLTLSALAKPANLNSDVMKSAVSSAAPEKKSGASAAAIKSKPVKESASTAPPRTEVTKVETPGATSEKSVAYDEHGFQLRTSGFRALSSTKIVPRYVGVRYSKSQTKPWQANGEDENGLHKVYLGCFKTELEAAAAIADHNRRKRQEDGDNPASKELQKNSDVKPKEEKQSSAKVAETKKSNRAKHKLKKFSKRVAKQVQKDREKKEGSAKMKEKENPKKRNGEQSKEDLAKKKARKQSSSSSSSGGICSSGGSESEKSEGGSSGGSTSAKLSPGMPLSGVIPYAFSGSGFGHATSKRVLTYHDAVRWQQHNRVQMQASMPLTPATSQQAAPRTPSHFRMTAAPSTPSALPQFSPQPSTPSALPQFSSQPSTPSALPQFGSQPSTPSGSAARRTAFDHEVAPHESQQAFPDASFQQMQEELQAFMEKESIRDNKAGNDRERKRKEDWDIFCRIETGSYFAGPVSAEEERARQQEFVKQQEFEEAEKEEARRHARKKRAFDAASLLPGPVADAQASSAPRNTAVCDPYEAAADDLEDDEEFSDGDLFESLQVLDTASSLEANPSADIEQSPPCNPG